MSTIELEGEAKEQYTVINDYNYGSELNVYKAYKKDDPECHYVIKSYKTKETFERESQMLRELHDTKNIVQIVDVYLSQSIIVCECALYDLETFLVHQDHIQRQEKIDSIIKDIISGLSELQKHNIVHTALAPKNIMYFQEKDGYTEIDFTMDMFSFGLILYFLETGHHYWDGVSEEKKEEILSTKYLPLRIHDPNACCVIKSLLSKNISRRMPLDKFMRTPYYTGESTNLSDYEINEEASQSNSTSVSRPNSTSLSRPNSTYLSPLRISNISNLSQDSFVAENWNYIHLYNRFLWLVVRYCAVKDRVVNSSLAKKTSILCRDILEINSIIKAGKSFNSHLSKLIMALKDQNNDKIQSELSNFAEDPCLDLAWGISIGVKYLHNQKIVHLDLRSENILLKYDEKEETLMPKISNFLWSREIYSGKTSAYPIITLSSGEEGLSLNHLANSEIVRRMKYTVHGTFKVICQWKITVYFKECGEEMEWEKIDQQFAIEYRMHIQKNESHDVIQKYYALNTEFETRVKEENRELDVTNINEKRAGKSPIDRVQEEIEDE
ncbi:unnamed protein product [Rhizophagus irregularis]|nr:unnamed protein product [Rhizophagus irregularis]